MDDAEVAAKVCALEAELAAASPRIADLEARVSLLEAENARWREAVPIPRGETFRRLEEGLSGSKQEAPQKEVAASFNKVGEGDEKGMAADVINRRRADDDGVLGLSTPKKLAVRAATGGSDDGDAIDDSGDGGGGGDHCDGIVGLADDDALTTPCGKKRPRVIASDSEDEGENGRDGEMEKGDATPSKKRVFRGLGDSDNEDNGEGVAETRADEDSEDDEDDNKPISEVFKKRRERRMRGEMMRNDAELGDTMPTTSPSARLVEKQSQNAEIKVNYKHLLSSSVQSCCGGHLLYVILYLIHHIASCYLDIG
jgi:hypothetical protein